MEKFLEDLLKSIILFIPVAQMLDVATTYYNIYVLGFQEMNAIMAPHMNNIPLVVGIKLTLGLAGAAVFYYIFFKWWAKSAVVQKYPIIYIATSGCVIYVLAFPLVTNMGGAILYHLARITGGFA